MNALFNKNILIYVRRKCIHFLFKLVNPKSISEDSQRREFILNILLLGTLVFTLLAIGRFILDFIEDGELYNKASPIILSIILSVFFSLYALSRKGYFVISSYIFIGIFFISATYTIYTWGIDLPQGLLTFVLVIIMSGILINTYFAFFVTLSSSFVLILFGYLQNQLIISPNLYWKKEMLGVDDATTFAFTFLIIAIVSWLSNREIEKSLKRARKSEIELKKERDLLEIRVKKRTQELKEVQEEKMVQIYRFAEFGRIASGIFHDLVNPLTAVGLNIEHLRKKYHGNDKKIDADLEKLESGIKQVKGFTKAAGRQIQNQEINIVFSLADEILLVLQMLSYKARKENVQLKFSPPNALIQMYGNPIKFYRFVTGLISNAIDAYEDMENTNKKSVVITLSQENRVIRITVSDSGCGIKYKNLAKIFEPLFTTKGAEKGIGIGLSICKEIVEKDFDGKISVKSEKYIKTIFTIILPIKNLPTYA